MPSPEHDPMLDPKEMKKGGFGSFAELNRERRELRRAAEEAEDRAKSTAEATDLPASDVVEAPVDAADGDSSMVRAHKTTRLPPSSPLD
jgi:hypothetical protein